MKLQYVQVPQGILVTMMTAAEYKHFRDITELHSEFTTDFEEYLNHYDMTEYVKITEENSTSVPGAIWAAIEIIKVDWDYFQHFQYLLQNWLDNHLTCIDLMENPPKREEPFHSQDLPLILN